MTQRAFVSDNNVATFVCPKCNAAKTADVSKFKGLNKAVRLKIKCPCGNTFSVTLERRKYYRKGSDFPGNYSFVSSDGDLQKGTLTVMDISRGGLKLKFGVMPEIRVGDSLNVEFNLDDSQQTLIKKEVLIKRITHQFIGVEFRLKDPPDPSDKALGFYLFR